MDEHSPRPMDAASGTRRKRGCNSHILPGAVIDETLSRTSTATGVPLDYLTDRLQSTVALGDPNAPWWPRTPTSRTGVRLWPETPQAARAPLRATTTTGPVSSTT